MKKQVADTTKIALFKGKKIRKVLHQNDWWFSIVDVIGVLTDSTNPQVYWRVFKKRLINEGSKETVTKCNGLKMPADDGKMRIADCANTEVLFRLIQSIPSPKAEPFKRWLARVGYERVKEIEDPELATKRTRRGNLRDHMDDFELIFTMLGERSTTEIHRNEDSEGVSKLKSDAKAGGEIAGGARRNLEKRLGRTIVSKKNYLQRRNMLGN